MNKEERVSFVNQMKMKLLINNYGFQENEQYSSDKGYQLSEVKKFQAIRELFIRLNIWVETGKLDNGTIEFPEAKRRIVYHLDDKNIANCKLHLLRN